MKARVTASAAYTIADIDKRLYGSFLEHLGRAVYTGIYEPGHPLADEQGMRKDVIELVRSLDTPICRYPGGNFVSAYNWEDGIGPKENRPKRLDLAWHTTETNQVGIHEFADWADKAGTDMMLAVNLGSRGLDAARAFVEYVNHPGGSYWSDLRVKNGRMDPWNCRLWCLGNEMDGPWQVGHKSAAEYGHLANETAKALRGFDPDAGAGGMRLLTLQHADLSAMGSDGARAHLRPGRLHLPAYVLRELREECRRVLWRYREVRPLHRHRRRHHRIRKGEVPLQSATSRSPSTSGTSGTTSARAMRERMKKWGWPEAPRLLEDIYNFEDVLQVGCILNTFIRRSDVVRIACIAQLVNVIAPIMTEPGGGSWRQTIYWPFMLASKYGRGTALQLPSTSHLQCGRRRQGTVVRHSRCTRCRRRQPHLLRHKPSRLGNDRS